MALLSDSRPAVPTLRPANPADAALLHAWRSEPSVRRHQPLQAASLADLRADLARQHPGDLYRARGDRFQWILEVDRVPVGWITLAITSWEQGVGELGYALTTEAQGRGLMVPALESLVRLLFEQTLLDRLEARCSVDNEASRQVLERCGFHREGLLRGYFRLGDRRVDNHLYARLRSDP